MVEKIGVEPTFPACKASVLTNYTISPYFLFHFLILSNNASKVILDFLYLEEFPKKEDDKVFSVEFLPGQFDQRADSAVQCVRFLNEEEKALLAASEAAVRKTNSILTEMNLI